MHGVSQEISESAHVEHYTLQRRFTSDLLSMEAHLTMSKLFTKLKEEFKALLPPTIFFLVALHLVAFIRVLMLKGTGVAVNTLWQVTLAALILGKAVLVADLLPFINRYPDKPLIYKSPGKRRFTCWWPCWSTTWSASSTSGKRPVVCGRQPEVARGDRVATFLGHPNSPGRADSDVLHHA